MKELLRKIQRKWAYSVVGLFTAFKEEKSLWAYIVIMGALIGLGVYAELSIWMWVIVVLIFFIVIAIEVINTALEASVDTISFQYNVKVKKIKDIAAAATLVITSGAFFANLLIFLNAFGVV